MADPVAQAYDGVAELYASLFRRELDEDADAWRWLTRFADLVPEGGLVADLGCGPGHGVEALTRLGCRAIGVDLSPGQVGQARLAFPELEFVVGDLTELMFADVSVGGIFARYSVIHLPPDELGAMFAEWHRVLSAGAPILVSFFASLDSDDHSRPFDHKVTTAYELWPTTIADLLRQIGFTAIEVGTVPPEPGARPFNRGTLLARR